jgi:hypothetical protein
VYGTTPNQSAHAWGTIQASGTYTYTVKLYGFYNGSYDHILASDTETVTGNSLPKTDTVACTPAHYLKSNIYANIGGTGHSDTAGDSLCNFI